MTRYNLIICFAFLFHHCYSQDVDSLINILEGKWDWYKTYGGFAGWTITPADSGFSITVEFVELQNDSVNFSLYKNDTLYRDTVATIFHLWGNHWAIDKNIIEIMRRYFPISIPQDYLGIVFTDSMDLVIYDAQVFDGYDIYFKRRINNLIHPINQVCTVKIFPNPFKDKTVIEFPNFNRDKYRLLVIDQSGKVIRIIENITDSRIELDRSSLAKGFYLIELRGPITYFGKILIE